VDLVAVAVALVAILDLAVEALVATTAAVVDLAEVAAAATTTTVVGDSEEGGLVASPNRFSFLSRTSFPRQ
jgi:hypothetical protein